jgi:pimeloyl-ACP methyl ester carboxylesterase
MASNGFRVLLYDLFGRGYSDSPSVKHNEHLYVAQLALLLRHVNWQSAALVGYSLVRYYP